MLLEGGVKVDRTEANGFRALQYAAAYGHLVVCCLLLEWGAKVDPLDGEKDTPLHLAAFWG